MELGYSLSQNYNFVGKVEEKLLLFRTMITSLRVRITKYVFLVGTSALILCILH